MFTPVIDLAVSKRATVLTFSDITGEDTVYAPAGTGWDGGAGIDSTDVTAAILGITDPNGAITTLNVLADITAADPVTADEEIQFNDIVDEWIDGYYSVVYNVWMIATNITSVDDWSGTVAGTVRIHSTAHGIVTGMKTTIVGVAGIYDGFYDATWIDADHFYISGTFSLTDTGTSTPCYSNTFTPFVYANAEIAIEKMYAIFAEMDEGVEGDEYLKHIELANGLLNALKSAITTTTVARVNNIYGRITRILDFNNMDLIYT
jgi:hypothetical protein